ncbi:hypothetical protein ACFL3D_05225, partial [Candidatus Omnitrophota bacterium]
LIFLLWILWPYLLYSIICVDKSSRYTLPILPAIALIIAMGIKELFAMLSFKTSRLFKVGITTMLLFYSIFSYFDLTFGQKIQQFSLHHDDVRFRDTGLLSPKYSNFNLNRLTRHFRKNNNHDQFILDASGWTYIANDTLLNYLAQNDMPITYQRLDYERKNADKQFHEKIKEADFLIFYSYDGTSVPNVDYDIHGAPTESIQINIQIFEDMYKNKFELIEKIYENDRNINVEERQRALLFYKRKI